MKKITLYALFSILALSFAIAAQENNRYSSSRLDNLANQLKRDTVDLADRASEDLRRNYSRSRRDIEAAFLAQQMDASVGLFQQMLRDNNNRAGDLRDAASILTDLARRAPNYGSNNNLWRNIQNSLNDINRELGGSGGGNNNNDYNNNTATVGRVFWRGYVDDRIHIKIRGSRLNVETISGKAYPEGDSNFTTALPRRNVTVGVDKKSGRGSARVIQQPSRENDYTTVIEVRDEDGGAKEYQLDIYWR